MWHRTGHLHGNQDILSAAELHRLDHACQQFQAAWEAGQRPRIEDFLAGVSDVARAQLLARLLERELACRSRVGEIPTAEEYERRFPADAETVRQLFRRPVPSPADRSEHVTHSNQNAVCAETETQLWEGPGTRTTRTAEQPESIGRYNVIGILGQGGFGTVYRARDDELQRDVAIKVWRPDRFAGDEDVERLLQEARLVARLDKHPAIVGVYDVGRQEDGGAFVVLQYIEGHSLAEELKSGKLGPDRVWEIMLQVTSAIQHAHAAGLVHRDLKPANVLLDADGNGHVADFGLAIDDENQRLHAGEVSGTPAYMAPEQVRGEAHRLDGRADLWALGVMLYQMLTGRRPFQGQSHQELFDEILYREPKPPRQLDPKIPADLEQICLKCLAKDVTQRYLTAADLAKDLRHAHQAPQRRKRRTVTIASVAAAGLLILAVFWGYLTRQVEPPVISVQPGAGIQIRHRATLRGHSDTVWSVAFSPDDRTLASAGVDKTIKLWDVGAGHEVLQLTGHRGEVRQVAFSRDGQTLASASGDRSIAVWDRETGALQPASAIRSVSFSPDGRRLASGGEDNTIRLWDAETGVELATLRGHEGSVTSVAFSSDGRILASASADKTVMMWELAEASPAKPAAPPALAAAGRVKAKDKPTAAKPSAAKEETGKERVEAPVEPTPSKVTPARQEQPLPNDPTTTAKTADAKPPGPPAVVRPPEPKAAQWITLEIERELLGWKAYGSGKWSVEEGGVLKGQGADGWLGTDEEYDDFELVVLLGMRYVDWLPACCYFG